MQLLWKLQITVVATPSTAIAEAFQVHCCHSQNTLYFFSLNTRHSLIGHGSYRDITAPSLHIIQLENALHPLKNTRPSVSGSNSRTLTHCGFYAELQLLSSGPGRLLLSFFAASTGIAQV